MTDYRRQRVADEIKRIVGEIFIKDIPPVDSILVTVTNVRITSDLREAKVYLSIYDENLKIRKREMKKIIARSSYIRGLLGNRITLKYVPKLFFFEDDTLDYVDNIERLIQSIHNKDDDE
ncbi:MAG: 30S ribosome-binding factor RbfA [Fidelibacterota bacterium]